MLTLAHLSDLHLPLPALASWRALTNKRVLGYLSYRFKRKWVHRQSVLAALVDDLHRQAPDHIVITGDLTNLALPEEFNAATTWLDDLATGAMLTVIPGNHDALVDVPWPQSLGRWTAYMSDADAAPTDPSGFPFVRRRGPIALVGVSSACPSPPFCATGRIGERQLGRLAQILDQLDSPSTCRVVLVHHPPIAGMMAHRKRLIDHAAFREVIRTAGAELILHGHHHRFSQDAIATPRGKAPVIGVPSASAARHLGHLHASYHLCRLDARDSGWQLEIEIRGLNEAEDGFLFERKLVKQVPRDPNPAHSSAFKASK
ncbi:MAG: metallophosphoesterase [Pseudomonadota bacterium]